MNFDELRKASQLGSFAMIDFALSYLIVIIIWIIGLMANWWVGGTILIKMLLSVIPIAIGSHLLISSKGKKLDPNTKRTAMTDLFLSKKITFGSAAVKIITVGSIIAVALL